MTEFPECTCSEDRNGGDPDQHTASCAWANAVEASEERAVVCPRCSHRFTLSTGFPDEWASCPECGLNGDVRVAAP
jgi:hypothetical protein